MEYAACNITMHGKCRGAIEFYEKSFSIEEKIILTFGDVAEQLNFGDFVQGKENLIYQAKLFFPCKSGKFLLMMGDSPSVLFNEGPMGNCKDNITINISNFPQGFMCQTLEK